MKWWTITLAIALALALLAGCDNAQSGGGISAGCPDANCSAYRP